MNTQDEMLILKTALKQEIEQKINDSQIDIAIQIINEYEKIEPADADIYGFRGVIFYMLGDLEQAEIYFKQAIVLNPYKIDTYFNLGYVYYDTQQFNKAYHQFKKVKQYAEDDASIEQAEQCMKDIEEKYPEHIDHMNDERKRVLVIAHIFPPIGGSGVQRTLKFVKYLQQNGWQPTILTVGFSKYPLVDASLLSEVPDNIEIIRIDEPASNIVNIRLNEIIELQANIVNAKELMDEFKKDIKLDSTQILCPDPYILWGIEVISAVKERFAIGDFDMIYSTSGPYTDHIIGYELKSYLQAPWVADFRDEWTNNPYADYDKNGSRYKLCYAMERAILSYADHIITTTPMAKENYETLFQVPPSKITSITNGYDEHDFEKITEQQAQNERFTIFHNGIMYSIRTPVTFFKAVHELINEGVIDKDLIQVGLPWSENDDVWKSYAQSLNLSDVVRFYGYMSHIESLQESSNADLLLLLVGPGEKNKAMYPGKIFEYLRLNKMILSLSPEGSVCDQLLQETERGFNVDYDDVEGIKKAVAESYRLWMNKDLPKYSVNDRVTIYERQQTTKQLADLFNQLVEARENDLNRKRLCFFSIKDGDKFINDTIEQLSPYFNIRKVIVSNMNQIEPAMEWADLCWFEWCDDLIAHASHLSIANTKHIICRIHRYEVFTSNPTRVDWTNVDKLIVVTDHLKALLKLRVPNIEEQVNIVTIHNGVNLDKFDWSRRSKGYSIAFIGYMITRKNPMMLLQIAYELVKRDPRYKIFIAGAFQDELLELYWNYQVKEMGLQDHVIFEGFQPNISNWLEDKHYIISTTMHESFGYGIAEAMARGIKPVIHNFLFSKEIWAEKYLFNTIEEAVRMIMDDDYNSNEYRMFIEQHYSLNKQIKLTSDLIQSVLEENKGDESTFLPVKLSHLKQSFDHFIAYNKDFSNEYDYRESTITIGRREQISEQYDLIEFILKNKNGEQLLVQNVWYDKNEQIISLPDYLNQSTMKEIILEYIRAVLKVEGHYRDRIFGFIPDPILLEDVKQNALIYGWERGIPATQFLPALGYLRIIERYKHAAKYMKETDVVLDAASGFGYGSAYFSKRVKQVIALDLAGDNIKFGKTYPFHNINWIEGDVTSLPVKLQSVDVYVSYETLEHLPLDIVSQYFEEALRVLKQGGKMIISTPNAENRRHIHNPYHIKEYTGIEFEELLKGFFSSVELFSTDNYRISDGIGEKSVNMIAVCTK